MTLGDKTDLPANVGEKRANALAQTMAGGDKMSPRRPGAELGMWFRFPLRDRASWPGRGRQGEDQAAHIRPCTCHWLRQGGLLVVVICAATGRGGRWVLSWPPVVVWLVKAVCANRVSVVSSTTAWHLTGSAGCLAPSFRSRSLRERGVCGNMGC